MIAQRVNMVKEDINFVPNIYRIAQEQYIKFEEPYRVNTAPPHQLISDWVGYVIIFIMKT